MPSRGLIQPDYTAPIARAGEPQFGALLINRSGVGAGEVDFGYRSPPDNWTPEEKGDLATAALMLYEAIVRDTGQRGSESVIERIKTAWEKDTDGPIHRIHDASAREDRRGRR